MKKKCKILIVEDEQGLRVTTKNMLARRNYDVYEAWSVLTALKELKRKKFDLVLLDLALPDGEGLDILKRFSAEYKNRFIVLTGTGTIEKAVEAMKEGAFDFLEKTVDRDVILATLEKAYELNRQLDEYRELKREFNHEPTFKKIIYKSQKMKTLQQKAVSVANTDTSVLVTGETGTGKDLISHALHDASRRRGGPFIPVNCATISKDLAESELFGFEKGAFTGAHQSYPGKFGLAEKGTIFLDEIAELSETVQAKLLRVLESGEIFPLRSQKSKKVDVRVIAATNKDLERMVQERAFREDLYYRIVHIHLHIPALRERKDDIMPLAEHFLRIGAISDSQEPKIVARESREYFENYPWPGNVRELKNTLYSIAPFIPSMQIKPEHLPLKISKYKDRKVEKPEKCFASLKEMEKKHIQTVLRATMFNIKKSARILDISRSTLYKKMDDYEIGR